MSEDVKNLTETISDVVEDVSEPPKLMHPAEETIPSISPAVPSPSPEETVATSTKPEDEAVSTTTTTTTTVSLTEMEETVSPSTTTVSTSIEPEENTTTTTSVGTIPAEDDIHNENVITSSIPPTSLKTDTVEDAESCSVEMQIETVVSETATNIGTSAATDEGEGGEASSTPKISTEPDADAKYTEHMTYESDGSAIYTDPETKHRYKWSIIENNWLPCDSDKNEITVTSTVNPYENDHYKWCSQTQKWLPKVQAQTTETEHYKWDAEKREWIAKDVVGVKTNNESKADSNDAENVTYDIDEDGNRIYTDKDGTVFFWDSTKNAWFPKIDDDFMAHYQMNYGFIDNTSESEAEKQRKIEDEKKLRELELQRMTEEAKAASEAASGDGATAAIAGGKRKAQEPPKWFDLNPEHNTKVYVSNLPLDITMDEYAELMGKCGMIMRDPQTQKYKLKLYAESDGQLKGDGLCDYIKVESVGLALNILDEYNLRGNKIRVQRAEFQMRGEYNPALKPKRKKKDKEKLQKMKEKLFDWRPEKMRGERSKNEKIVIIKNLFEPSIFEKEVQLILDYQNELREECSKCGTVRKVVIYDRHPEGVAQVNMADPEEADVVIQMMQGRYFGQRKLSAEHWDGKTKYKIIESEAEVQQRLSNWDQYLKQEENERKDVASKAQKTTAEVTNEVSEDKQSDALEEASQSAESNGKVTENE